MKGPCPLSLPEKLPAADIAQTGGRYVHIPNRRKEQREEVPVSHGQDDVRITWGFSMLWGYGYETLCKEW